MANKAKSTKVPAAQQDNYMRLTTLTDDFCAQHLTEGYAELARSAIAALCRKRPSPLGNGRANSWACGVIYAIGQLNFLFDKSNNPSMTATDLCAHFNLTASTGRNKAKQVHNAIGMHSYDFRWALPETIEAAGSLFWLIEYNGLAVDARDLPRDVQEAAFEHGVIPYVHADKGKTEDQIAEGKLVRARYDIYREINSYHQTRLGREWFDTSVQHMAIRLGLVDEPGDLAGMELIDVVPAVDLALYQLDDEGRSAMSRDLEAWPGRLTSEERRVFDAMTRSRFSVFEVTGKHAVAGVTLRDLFTGDELWLIDRGLEANAPAGLLIALRLIRPDSFWMTTGAQALVTDETWTKSNQHFGDNKNVPPDPDRLAEFIFQARPEGHPVTSAAA